MASSTSNESRSSQEFAARITQTRMDVRLAIRAGLHSMLASRHTLNIPPQVEPRREEAMPVLHRREEAHSAKLTSVMEPLMPKKEALTPELEASEETLEELEDDAWLNDMRPPRPGPASPGPIPGEQLANDYTLTCWF